ncbi:MAG TPA: VWA domain-containing protein [Vicinamibacterales bacterium]|nr:VWA domain-containing protein [Vicinamibacterales bacterium]
MSFGAMAAWQALLLIAAAAAAAVAIFRMKLRPPRVQVPSLLLWRRVFDHARELTWWEKVRRAVSLVATALIAVLLALAVTRPGPRRGQASEGRVLIVLDSSWSMAARTKSGETRWQRAVRQARSLAASAAGDVALATTADGLVEGPTSDTALLETAIDRLRPSGGDSAAWPRVPGTDRVYFITDGAVARALDPGVIVQSVFEAAGNAAIVAFGARPSLGGGGTGEAYVQVANYAPVGRAVRLIVSRGQAVLSDQRADMAAGEAVSAVVPLAATGSARLVARIETEDDALAEDNEAVAWIEGVDAVNVSVVSENPSTIGALLQQDPSLQVVFVKPAEYKPATGGIVIFDRWLPPQTPTQPALCIAPPASVWLGEPGANEPGARWIAGGTHPVIAGVDPLTIDVKRVRGYSGPDLTTLAASEKGTPLISVMDRPDRRVVVWSFSPADSNLASAPAFPVLFGNTIEWLARPSFGVLRHAGPVELPASTARLVSPDGLPVPVVKSGDRAVARLTSPGLYLVEAGGARGVIGVNVGDPDVSNLSRSSLTSTATAHVAAGGAGWPYWMWAVGVGLVLAATEWWTWQRRVTV